MLNLARTSMLALCCAALVGGCATSHLTAADESRIRNVAIVSLVPDKAGFVKIGFTLLGNDRGDIDLGGRITQTVESVARARLNQSRPAWSIRSIDYDRTALFERLRSPGLILAFDEEKIRSQLADLVRSNQLDALILISPQGPDASGLEGVGIWLRTALLPSMRVAFAHSNIGLKVIGPDGHVIAVATGSPEPAKELDPDSLGIGPDLKDDVRPDLIARLSDEIIDVLTKSLNRRFDQLSL